MPSLRSPRFEFIARDPIVQDTFCAQSHASRWRSHNVAETPTMRESKPCASLVMASPVELPVAVPLVVVPVVAPPAVPPLAVPVVVPHLHLKCCSQVACVVRSLHTAALNILLA